MEIVGPGGGVARWPRRLVSVRDRRKSRGFPDGTNFAVSSVWRDSRGPGQCYPGVRPGKCAEARQRGYGVDAGRHGARADDDRAPIGVVLRRHGAQEERAVDGRIFVSELTHVVQIRSGKVDATADAL